MAIEERVLVWIGDPERAGAALSALGRHGLRVELLGELSRLREEMERGAGALLLGEEIIQSREFDALVATVADQPSWSDLPLILIVRDSHEAWHRLEGSDLMREGANLVLVESPVPESSLVNSARVALRARRRQYHVRDLLGEREAILGSIRDPLVLLDKNLRFTYVNDRAAEVHGCRREQLIGRRKTEVFPDIGDTPYHRALLDAISQRKLQCLEQQDPVTENWYEMRVYPSGDGVAVFRSDITERKHAEEELRQSEKRLRLMIESAIEYAIFSMDGAGRITSWNSGAERILGYSEDEILGQPMDLIYTPEDRFGEVPSKERAQAKLEGRAEDERWHQRKDGSRFWAGGQIMPMLDGGGQVRGYLKILRDYTGRKQAETWLVALNETLEKRVAERTEEAEHRATQLQMLAGELTAAEERERRRLAELLHDHLQQILVAAKMQVGILSQRALESPVADSLKHVDSLLARSIEASRSLTVELSPPILYDAGLGPAFHWLARRMQEDHGFEVSVEAEEDADTESENLRVFLFQAARELLFNVVKHAGVKEARIRLSRTDDEVEARVEDAGVGFDAGDKCARLKGKGFGLFSIAERVKLLGGTISIVSAPGEGSGISVRVPLAQPDRETVDINGGKEEEIFAEGSQSGLAPRPYVESAGRIRILIADDHKILREGLAGLLSEQTDFDLVGEASDGVIAVEMAREVQPDVIIMDVSMPRMNGVEATRRINAEMPRIKIIALSMHAQEDMAEAMRMAGAFGYMTKGVPSEILTAAIRDAAADAARQNGLNVL